MVLNPVISKLSGKLVVLASSSPRRLEILTNVGLRFEVVPSWFKETLNKSLFKEPHQYAVETARQKALEVARRMPFKHLKTPDVVIGADTIVTIDGLILEKPRDKQDAYRMLSRLSGKEHSVCTGVAIVLCNQQENEETEYQTIDFYEETRVKFADLSETMLWDYIDSGEPMDKAGGYGIQALGGMLVEYIHGDFLNVVGFPLNRFCKQLDLLFNPELASNEVVHTDVRFNGSTTDPIENPSSTSSLSSPATSNPPQAEITIQNGPPTSPAPKMKRKDGRSAPEDSSWAMVNSLSKCSEGQENMSAAGSAVPSVASRGPMNLVIEKVHTDDLKRIVELMDGFKASKALFTASKMRVFDLLQKRPGLEGAEVARGLQASLKGTLCLLEACVSLGLLERKQGANEEGVYENSRLSQRFLVSDSPSSLLGYMAHSDETVWKLFSHLETSVREGTNLQAKVSAQTTNDLFQDMYSDDERKLRFMKAMHGIAAVAGPAVITAFDLSRFKTACDLGGCTGSMAHGLAKAYPRMSVTVYDLPSVVELSGTFCPPGLDNRVSFVAGDFFKDRLPKADLYILARILHDWTDDKVHALLSKISDACTPGCGLLVSEIFLDRDRTGPSQGLLQALGLGPGKQRSAGEYGALLESHGFTVSHIAHTDSLLDALLCIKD
ncbi:probable bifunctional dTTP/UTP pyrophosphatase/methyltransferase protein [Gadus chalcogrammus]|uniref:probable bifunctional dTTP/UTP pyrophosphatase/methyltransferase protein n=1 Tax=Gadus chalcogrammus TaxID=1042646 RepID=UPI0024C4D523|nr:probable bifunctional dTTP/UTP pyrophosphatase/methyltransferase protein [Gadus chalcogrammus]XP_056436002.1 probable bifunctional dTTP/UTP pyrophosphatase/methyltransferase protein [Gadus chalcogrammus]